MYENKAFERRLQLRIEQCETDYELIKLGIKEKIRRSVESGDLLGDSVKWYGKRLKKAEADVMFARMRLEQYRRKQAELKRKGEEKR